MAKGKKEEMDFHFSDASIKVGEKDIPPVLKGVFAALDKKPDGELFLYAQVASMSGVRLGRLRQAVCGDGGVPQFLSDYRLYTSVKGRYRAVWGNKRTIAALRRKLANI